MDDESPDVPDDAVDLSNDETRERQQKRVRDELTDDDIQTPEIREAVESARELQDEADEADEGTTVELSEPPADDETAREMLERIEEDNESAGVTDDVADEQVEEMMDDVGLGDLEVREDIDPEHFDYEGQDFEDFSAYGQQANVVYNGAVFLLEQPDDPTQQKLMNDMQSSSFAGAMSPEEAAQQTSMGEMMDKMIEHTVARPSNIDELVAEWSPFERMGLGLQCMEFLGLDALGNM